jgi:Fe2+ transport system protein FeoA
VKWDWIRACCESVSMPLACWRLGPFRLRSVPPAASRERIDVAHEDPKSAAAAQAQGASGGQVGRREWGGREVPLTRLRRGQTGMICEARLSEDDAALLRAMGVAADARIRLCRSGQPCIVAVGCACIRGGGTRWGGCRIGLARPLAERITVLVSD